MNTVSAHANPAKSFTIVQEPPVRWFDVSQLFATGMKTLAANIVGAMSGRREIMAALDPQNEDRNAHHRHDESEEIWLDYLADTGDGWNATTSIAWLVGRDGIKLAQNCLATPQAASDSCMTELTPMVDANSYVLPAGQLTVLGGDEVYPTASAVSYQRRFIDPFRCARYFQKGGRAIYAIPGNHDWYDGLTGFLRLFCQIKDNRRWFGAWQAQQRRSYFSLQLPHGWWLWGVDTALEDDLDPPQYDYFAAQARKFKKGDRLILCVPNPTWIEIDAAEFARDPTTSRKASKLNLIMNLAADTKFGPGASVPLVISGDLHFYARHEAAIDNGTRQYVVCGGGGAFGLGTLQVPERINLVEAINTRAGSVAQRQMVYPSAKQSKQLRWGVLKFPFMSGAFTLALTVFNLITLWGLASIQRQMRSHGWIAFLMDSTTFDVQGLLTAFSTATITALTTPGLFFWWATLLAGFIGFAISGKRRGGTLFAPSIAGVLHALAQIAGGMACYWLVAKLIQNISPDFKYQWVAVIFASALVYCYSGFLFGVYLFITHVLFGLHDQEVFSAQGIEDFKSFLRIKISKDGLIIYPIGLEKVARDWKAAPGVRLSAASRVRQMARSIPITRSIDLPANAQRAVDPAAPLAPHLIEQPIFIR